VFVFGVYALIDAGIALTHAVHGDAGASRWMYVVEAIAGAAFGLIALLNPGAAAAVLLVILAGWSLSIGTIRLIAAYRLRNAIRGEWLIILSGILSVLVGIWILAAPMLLGALAVVTVIGVYALVFGIISLMQGLRLRAAVRRQTTAAARPA
jgi:uncharacterized membrane protein HdeD (DUF308 family)